MQCKYVRQSTCMSFAFHPKTISLFSLVHFKNRLRIIQQNLYTGLIMNDFPVPLRQQTLQVDNYSLCYNQILDLVIFTLSNHVLIYSVSKKTLLVVAETSNKNSPLYIIKTVTKGNNMYFSTTEQKIIYGFNLQQCIQNANINMYIRYKLANQAEIQQIAVTNTILVALCSDRVLRVWDLESTNMLKGIAIQNVGRPICFNFSKNDGMLLIGTSDGIVQAWDGESLGVKNTRVMSQKISNTTIKSLCWFHYAGQSQSLRFLTFTTDGNIKLYSFFFQKKQQTYVGKCIQLSLLYINRHEILDNYMIKSHLFANFVFFSPGILLYMVDSHSLIYYPVVMKQPSANFQQLVPNAKKQIYYTRDILFMKGLEIKRVKDTIQDKLSLQNDLEYKDLKILRLDMRPWSNQFVSQQTKLMVVYYLNSTTRVITLSKLNLNQKNQNLNAYKQYSGSWITFIGRKQYYQPFILIVQQDKQTITVLAQNPSHPQDIQIASQQQRKYFEIGPGELYTKKITIKIQKLYVTPFRYNYVLLYQSDNLLRFSNNINYDTELLNYDVYVGLSLRMDYNDIILDVIWTYGGEIGAVICLDKVVFINADLKVMRNVIVAGYVVQGQWIGYTLLITTKKDIQYFDILSKPQQAYCLQNLQSKYLIMRVMVDRIIGAQKTIDCSINIKTRYFKIMQPLISGYLNYQQIADIPIDTNKIKYIIQSFAPYFNVSQQFIYLLNNRGLSNISKYFLQGNQKMYSKPLRAKTLNNIVKIERFIPQNIWNKNKRMLVDLYLNYQQSKDSNDPYQIEKGKQYANKIKIIIGNIAFDSIKDLSSTEINKGVKISNNFGQNNLFQLYYDVNKDGQICKMEIYPFKAENCGEWLGQFGMYIESKPYFDDDSSNDNNTMNNMDNMGNGVGSSNMMMHEQEQSKHENASSQQQDDDNVFKNLILYYRCDDGKGTTVEDLSDYGNNGGIEQDDNWNALYDEPMQVQDKWGKKCPPQFSLTTPITVSKKLNMRRMKRITIQFWIKPLKPNFNLLKFGKQIQIFVQNLELQIKMDGHIINLTDKKLSQNHLKIDEWCHIAIILDPKQKQSLIYLNSQLSSKKTNFTFKLPRIITSLLVSDGKKAVQYTQLRIWTKNLSSQDIKQNIRTPLQLVAQKRKRLKMKLKQKKNKEQIGTLGMNPFSLD